MTEEIKSLDEILSYAVNDENKVLESNIRAEVQADIDQALRKIIGDDHLPNEKSSMRTRDIAARHRVNEVKEAQRTRARKAGYML